MSRIPQPFIDELVSRSDIVDIIDSRVALKKRGREFIARCPFHSEKTPSFTVSTTKQFYHCFGCGAHGTVLSFLMDYEHLDFREAVEQLAAQLGLGIPDDDPKHGAEHTQPSLYPLLDSAAQFYKEHLRQTPRAIEYLKNRGISGETCRDFGVGYAPPAWDALLRQFHGQQAASRRELLDAGLIARKDQRVYDRFRDRIMFPIRDRRGRVVGFGGRIIDRGEPKYLNSPETPLFHKGRELYGLFEARRALRHIPRLLIVEGYMDVMMLAQHGIHYAVATLGTAATEQHLNRLFRVSDDIVFCFDGDAAGRRAGWRALENALPLMQDGRSVRFLFLPEGEDPDSIVRTHGRRAFEERIESAQSLSKFMFDTLTAQTHLDDAGGRARLVDSAQPLIKRLPEGVFRYMLSEQLARLARVNVDRLSAPKGASAARPPPASPRHVVRVTGPVRKALAMLLHRPALATTVDANPGLAEIDVKGAAILKEVLDFSREHPQITMAGLIAHWQHAAIGDYLLKLSSAELVTPEDGLESEFGALIRDLTATRPAEQRIERLLSEARERDLNDTEKTELRQLLLARGKRATKTP